LRAGGGGGCHERSRRMRTKERERERSRFILTLCTTHTSHYVSSSYPYLPAYLHKCLSTSLYYTYHPADDAFIRRSTDIALSIAQRYQQLKLDVGVLVIDYKNQLHDGDWAPNPSCYPSVCDLRLSLCQLEYNVHCSNNRTYSNIQVDFQCTRLLVVGIPPLLCP
jgi:hypothetical protein